MEGFESRSPWLRLGQLPALTQVRSLARVVFLLGEPFHRADRPYGFGGLRFALLFERRRALTRPLVIPLVRERALEPLQELRGRIHLVVVLALRKHDHLV